MTKRMKLLWVAGAVLLAVGGAAMASNMGFKFVPNIANGAPAVYDISIPLNNNYTTLRSIFDDINASAGCSAAAVINFNNSPIGTGSCTWAGPFTCDSTYHKGESVWVKVAASTSCTGWVVVGSHDPSFQFSFTQNQPARYEVSVPYHTTETSLASLYAEIPSCSSVDAAGNGTSPAQTHCTWAGPFTCNQPLSIGQGVAIKVNSPTLPVQWTPSHY